MPIRFARATSGQCHAARRYHPTQQPPRPIPVQLTMHTFQPTCGCVPRNPCIDQTHIIALRIHIALQLRDQSIFRNQTIPMGQLSPSIRTSMRSSALAIEAQIRKHAISILPIMPKGPYEKGKFTIRPNCFMTSPIISLSNVHLSLESNAGTVEILKNISLDVSAGESLGLIGPSGSGKSSLLMLLGGLERPAVGW